MDNKKIKEFIVDFILFIFLSLVITLVVNYNIVFSPRYIYKILDKTNFYSNFTTSITDELSNYTIQSGLDTSVMNDVVKEFDVRKIVNDSIESIYFETTFSIDTTKFKDRLKNKIIEYLSKSYVEVQNKDELDNYINMIDGIYRKEFRIFNYLSRLEPQYKKITKLYKLVLVLSILITAGLFIYKMSKKTRPRCTLFALPLTATGMNMIFLYFVIKLNVYVDSIYIYDKAISSLISNIYINLLNKLLITGIICFILGILLKVYFEVQKIQKRKRKKEKKKKKIY